MIDWTELIERIGASSRILLTAHIRPDGDCIGSAIALSRALRRLGKEARIINGHATPPNLAFLDPDGVIRPVAELSEDERRWVESVDLLLVLDTSSWQQLGGMGDIVKAARCPKVVIDHHESGDDLGAEMLVDKTSEATGRLVLELLRSLGVALDRSISDPLFAAITTDTGWFRFASVNADTFRAAAELVEAGTRPDDLYKFLYEQETLGRIRLVGRALAKTEPHLDGRLMVTAITLEDLDRAGAIPSETEDIVNMTLQVDGSLAAVILVEQRSGGFKLSFRSRCDLDCSLLAKQFGGGGHKKAAGAFLDKPYEEARNAVLAAVTAAFDRLGKE